MGVDKQNIYERLLNVKKEVVYIQKKQSKYQKFSTTSSKDVLTSINPELNKNNLLLSVAIEESHVDRHFVKINEKGNAVFSFLVSLNLVYTFTCTDNPEQQIRLSFFATADDGNSSYAFGKAMTYAEKTFFLKEFNIAIDENPEEEYQNQLMDKIPAEARDIKAVDLLIEKVIKFSPATDSDTILMQACATNNIDLSKPKEKYTMRDAGLLKNTLNTWYLHYEKQAAKEKKEKELAETKK